MQNLRDRLQVMLTPRTAECIKRLARLQNRSRSAVVRDFLDEVAPVLHRTANLLELAQKAQGDWPKQLATRMQKMQEGLEAHALVAMDSLDLIATDRTEKAPTGAAGAANPPMTNRGVTQPKKTSHVSQTDKPPRTRKRRRG